MDEPNLRRARKLRFGPFELDTRAGELRKHGVRLRLREQPLRILLLLLEVPGEIVLRTTIREKLWPNETVVEFDHGINTAIRRLREALGESAEKPRYIETLARRGYRFLADVETIEAPSSELSPQPTNPDSKTDDLEGKAVSHYLVFDKLGRGGMGVVFRARDLKLKRNVALKFLPEEYSRHPQLLERFHQEARAAAALNHPNICIIYEIGEDRNRPFIAMELLEGQTVKDLLSERQLQASESVDLGLQIASALEVAHKRGIVHRDIKPANIFVTRAGQVKILDFGLAKLVAGHSFSTIHTLPEVESAESLGEAALSSPVGTVAYMSPEQVRGENVDSRSDIFSAGVVLYEMVGGRRAFGGESSAETMDAILTDNPPELPASVPPALDQVVRRCLEKQPERRFQLAAELGLALQTVLTTEPLAIPSRRQKQIPGIPPAWIPATALLGLLVAVLTVLHFREKPAKQPLIQFSFSPPPGVGVGEVRYQGPPLISPDGTQLAFGGIDGRGVSELWLRPLSSLTARPLAGTEGAWYPFWSPDSRWLGFFVGRKLKRISIDGGQPQTLANAGCCGGTWGRPDRGLGTIIFPAPEQSRGLLQIGEDGGEPRQITQLNLSSHELRHCQPQFLPDGRHFLFVAAADPSDYDAVFIADTEGKPGPKNRRSLLRRTSRTWWAPPGHLLFLQDNNLMAQPFDSIRQELTGPSFVVAEHVGTGFNTYTSDFSVSFNGVLAWRSGFNAIRQLAWFDRTGRQLPGLDAREPYISPRLSPDGAWVALIRLETPVVVGGFQDSESSLTRNIWLYNLKTGSLSPFTFGAAIQPVWSPDGRRMIFGRNEPGRRGLYWKPVSGGGDEEPLLKTDEKIIPTSWSRDGKFLLFQQSNNNGDSHLFALPLSGDRVPFSVARTAYQGEFSPDARWFAYVSAESGHGEIVVRSLMPDNNGASPLQWQVSNKGGWQPRWRQDGRELFYWDLSRKMMAVTVSAAGGFKAGVPVTLFDLHDSDPGNFDYSVSADGQRFLISRIAEDGNRPINISLDWLAVAKH